MASLQALPLELASVIVSFIDTSSTLLSLARVNRAWNREVEMLLYRHSRLVVVHVGHRSYTTTLQFFISVRDNPERAKYVRTLDISLYCAMTQVLELIELVLPLLSNLESLKFNPHRRSSNYSEWVLRNLPSSLRMLECDISAGPSLWVILRRLPRLRHISLPPSHPDYYRTRDGNQTVFPSDVGKELSSVGADWPCLESIVSNRFISSVHIKELRLSDLENAMSCLRLSRQPITALSIRLMDGRINYTALNTISHYNSNLASLRIIWSGAGSSLPAGQCPPSAPFQQLRNLHIEVTALALPSLEPLCLAVKSWVECCPNLSNVFLCVWDTGAEYKATVQWDRQKPSIYAVE